MGPLFASKGLAQLGASKSTYWGLCVCEGPLFSSRCFVVQVDIPRSLSYWMEPLFVPRDSTTQMDIPRSWY
jgi:hypothetical protein